MGKIRLNHWYTKAEVDRMLQDPALARFQVKGYYLETDGGRFRFIHDSQAAANRAPMTATGVIEAPEPIRKRRPVERVDSLMLKLVDDMKRYGTIPGMTDEAVSEIVGEAWKTGRTEVTTEAVRRIAANLLAKAEADQKAHDSHFSTTPA